MGIGASVISAVLKSVIGDKIGTGLIKELADITIGEVSEKSIIKINDFINGEKSKIENILSKENMISMNIPEESADYVVAEIKDLLSGVSITGEILRQCRYDSMNLSAFLWKEYFEGRDSNIECESHIKKALFAVAEALIKLFRESDTFEKDFLIQISNSVDDIDDDIHNISNYIVDNFYKLNEDNKNIICILLMIFEQIREMHIQVNGASIVPVESKKFKNNKKQDYIKNWNSRLFLHVDNDERPITLKDAFIMPSFIYYRFGKIAEIESESVEEIISNFFIYNSSSNMLITGEPGMGKSSIVSWLANRYKNDMNIIILRFRDWECEHLEKGLFRAIYSSLKCKRSDLEDIVLVLDGFDEIKDVGRKESLLSSFITETLGFNNIKIIITSRPGYIDSKNFRNHINLLPFEIDKIKRFYKVIKGVDLDINNLSNRDVLGIPVILYLALMSDIDITKNTTKPDLYNLIFSEIGGIFDKFSYKGIAYEEGAQPLRDRLNVKKYLRFLRETAFKMFEKDSLILYKDKCLIPQMEFQGVSFSVLEFPIKHFFENIEDKIEFIHSSIYEYFAAEYIYIMIINNITKPKDVLAGVFCKILKNNRISKEILEFLKYHIKEDIEIKYEYISEVFNIMLQNGMTFYAASKGENLIIEEEMLLFINMLEIVHLWEKDCMIFDASIIKYLQYNNWRGLNLRYIELEGVNLENVNLRYSDLTGANLNGVNLSGANLEGVDLKNVKLNHAILSDANLLGAKLENTILIEANLERADLRNVTFNKEDLEGTIMTGTIVDEIQYEYLTSRYQLKGTKICLEATKDIISYERYSKINKNKIWRYYWKFL